MYKRQAMDYLMFQRGVDAAAVRESMGTIATYTSHISEDDNIIRLEVQK